MRVYNETRSQAQIQADMVASVYYEPFNLEATITDMEADSTVFVNKYYTFQGIYGHEYSTDLFDTVKLAFTDGDTWINASYDAVDEEWSLDSGSDIARIQVGTATYSDPNMTVTFPILLNEDVLDAINITIYLYSIDTDANIDDWEAVATDYFNILNLGGFVETVVSGTAGRTVGGHQFDLWATGGGNYATSTMTYPTIQSAVWHSVFNVSVDPTQTEDYGYWEYGLTWNVNDTWAGGFRVRLYAYDELIHALAINEFNLHVKWYTHNGNDWDLIKTDDIFGVYKGSEDSTWWFIYLWVDVENASTTVGGRVNPKFFKNPTFSDVKAHTSTFQGTMYDDNGTIVSIKQADLMRVWQTTYKDDTNSSESLETKLTRFMIQTDNKEGIDHPEFTDASLWSRGWNPFAFVMRWFSQVGEYINNIFGPVALKSWSIFLAFLDSIAGWIGAPNFFTNLLSWISTFMAWLYTSMSSLITILTRLFLFWGTMGTRTLGFMVSVLTWWGLMFTHAFDVIGNGLGTLPNMWNVLGGSYWMILLIILYPIWRLTGKHPEKMIDDMKIIMDVFSLIFNVLLSVAQFVIDLVGRAIESVPILE